MLISSFIFVFFIFEIMILSNIFCLSSYSLLLSVGMTYYVIWFDILYETSISRHYFLLFLNVGNAFHILKNFLVFFYVRNISCIKRHKFIRSDIILMFLINYWIFWFISLIANNRIFDLFFFFIYRITLN